MSEETLSRTLAALADPTRRAMLARLARGPSTVQELGAPFDISAPAISKHLRVLERAGLIVQGREAQWRPCHLVAKPLSEVADFAERYRQFWEGSLDHLDDYLRDLGTHSGAEKPRRRKRRDSPKPGQTLGPRKKGTKP